MITRNLLLAGISVLGLSNAAYAANTHVQSSTPAHAGSVFEGSKTTTFSAAVGNGHHVMGFARCYNYAAPPTVVSVKDNTGASLNIADNFLGLDANGQQNSYRVVSFYATGVTNGMTSVTVTWSANCQYNNIAADEFSGSLQTGAPVHASNAQDAVPAATDNITSTNVTASAAGSLAYGMNSDSGGIHNSNGTGWTAGITDETAGDDYVYTQYRLAQAAGTFASTMTSTGTASSNMSAVMVFAPPGPPTPVSAVCMQTGSPNNNPTLPDNSLANAAACNFVVTMSDASTYTGTNTVSQQGCTSGCLFTSASVPATGNGNLVIARNAASTDDGTQVALMNFTENGVSLPLTVNLAVTPTTSSAGIPEAIGWKGINPSGAVVFTAPRSMTVTSITGVVSTPAGGPALVDVYKVPGASGLACTSGTKLHTGDFNANNTAGINQTLPLAVSALAQGDDVCLVTSGTQWNAIPATAGSTITVTAN